jgi:ubiquinone/menaquinone biosynthesis C-methylase UbiE
VPVSATTKEWRALALDDPLFAVAAWPGKEHAWDADAFYATGKEDWITFKQRWHQYADLGSECIEIGCGAGRITKQLASDFDTVYAVDVSEAMLNLAGRAAPSATLVLTDGGRLPLPNECADSAFSCHVLQHLENHDAVSAALGELYRCIRPGGTCMLHFLVRERTPSPPRRVRAELRLRWTRLRNANRGAYSRVRRYYPSEIRAMCETAGFRDVELREFAAGSNAGPHAFWFARRSR